MNNSTNSLGTRASIFLRMSDEGSREMAWQEFHDKYAPMIAGFARRLGVHEAGDVVQEVLTGFFVQSPVFTYEPSRGKFRSYLMTCTHRTVCKYLRKKKATPSDPSELDLQVEHAWEDVWEKELLHRAYGRVRDQYGNNRTFRAFSRVVLEDEDVRHVASDLGMSVDSVYKAKQRVARALYDELKSLRSDVG